MGLRPSEIQGMTPRELARTWDAYFDRQSDTMDTLATALFWLCSIHSSEVILEDIRGSLGWQKAKKKDEDDEE